jgi:DNA-binding MarR family transcriptional regulator
MLGWAMTQPDYTPDAVRTLARLSRVLERGAGDLSLAQYRILAVVADGGERASWLAERLAVAKPTITAVVDGLVERGYLCRTADDGDRRVTRITLTQTGRRALGKAEATMAESLTDLLAHADEPAAVVWALSELGTALDRVRAQRVAAERR